LRRPVSDAGSEIGDPQFALRTPRTKRRLISARNQKKSNRADLAGWLRSASQAPATAEILHRLRRNCTAPASFRYATAARSARQAIGRPPPALAGQRSAFLPIARRAPLSHNGAWWIAEIFFRGIPPRYATTAIMRSGLRSAPLGGGCPSTLVFHRSRRGGGRWLAPGKSRRITPPTQGPPPWASLTLAPGSRPHAEKAGIAGNISPPHRLRGFGFEGGFGRAGEGGFGCGRLSPPKNSV